MAEYRIFLLIPRKTSVHRAIIIRDTYAQVTVKRKPALSVTVHYDYPVGERGEKNW
jgi:hypothetical protein